MTVEEIRKIATDGTPKWDGWGNEVVLDLLAFLDERDKKIGELERLKQLVIQELLHLEYQIKCLEGAGLHSGSLPEIYKMLLTESLKPSISIKRRNQNDRD